MFGALFRGFHGGVHPDDSKSQTRGKPVEVMAPPERVVIPMSMHIGAPCEPIVKVGSLVKMGMKIADSNSPVSVPIHSSVSGRVSAIEPRLHPNGLKVLSVVIENDGLDTPDESIRPRGSAESLSPEDIMSIVREAGIVGLGGAAFPTHMKIKSSIGKVNTLIINAAECEPFLTSDHRLMLESPEDVIGGVKALMKALGLKEAVIGIESNKYDAAEALRRTLPRSGSTIHIKVLQTRYPQGGEKQIIEAITGRQVPPGRLPEAVGCAVFNVSTAAAVHRAITTGAPLISRVVTVSGPVISNPKNLVVRVGTLFRSVIDAAGGFKEEPDKIIAGGPMMGLAQYSLDVPVLRATNGILALSAREDRTVKDPQCIRCGKCVSVCPVNLMPVYMYMYERKNMLDELAKLNITDCIECGSCSYVCPARLFLVQSFRTGKQKLSAARRKTSGE